MCTVSVVANNEAALSSESSPLRRSSNLSPSAEDVSRVDWEMVGGGMSVKLKV